MDKEWLENEYLVKDRSSQDIANEYGCKRNTIQQWLAKFKIKKEVHKKQIDSYEYLYENYVLLGRELGDIAQTNHITVSDVKYYLTKYKIELRPQPERKLKYEDDIDEIIHLYQDEKISAYQIGKKFGTTHNTIIRLLQKYGIETRDYSKAQLVCKGKEVSDIFYDKEKLDALHNKLNVPCTKIGDILNISPGAVRRQMHRLGLKTKDNSESKIGLMVGENHPNWQGGKTSLYQLLREYSTTNLSTKARKRDGNKCCICGKDSEILHGHHIIPFKDIVNSICNDYPYLDQEDPIDKQTLYNLITNDKRFLDLNNIITVCPECHMKLHGKTISSQASEEEGSETIS